MRVQITLKIAALLFVFTAVSGCENQTFTFTVGSQEPVRAGIDPAAGQACVGVDDAGRRTLVARSECQGTGRNTVRR